jgi:hypothetical protein
VQDLAQFRVLIAELVAKAQAAGVDADLLIAAQDATREIADELRDRRYKPGTLAQVAQLAKLEAQMVDFDARDRVPAICERMGIKRSRYFELRKLVRSPDRTGQRDSRPEQRARRAEGTKR